MKYIYTILIIISFTFCNDKEINSEDSSIITLRDEIKINDSLNDLNFEKLKTKYNGVLLNNDSINFTYEVEDLIKSSKRPILIKGMIIDIIKNNEGYKLIITYSFSGVFYIKSVLNIDELLFSKLKTQLRGKYNDGYFVFTPISITTLSPMLKAMNISSESISTENDADLTYDLDEIVLKLEGQLSCVQVISAILNKRQKSF